MNNLKKYNNFVTEVKECQNLLELEYAADQFDKGIIKGEFSLKNSEDFNPVYWKLKNKFVYNSIKDNFKGINKLDLLSIVKNAPNKIKDDKNALTYYIKRIIKNLKKKQKIA